MLDFGVSFVLAKAPSFDTVLLDGLPSRDSIPSNMTPSRALMKRLRHLHIDVASTSLGGWFDQPLSNTLCIVGWLVGAVVFIGLAELLGGPTRADDNVSIYSALAIAHGNLSCAYPPPGSIGFLSTAPLFQLLSGGAAAVLRLGHSLDFPSKMQMGTNCSHSPSTILDWALKSGTLNSMLRLGYLGWFAIEAGTVTVMRASGRGRTRWEPATVLLVAFVPPVVMCIVQFFHPQDLLAVGLSLIGVACALRGRWELSGAWLGLALVSQQFSLLVFIPLVVCAPRRQALKAVAAAAVSIAVIAVPLMILTSGRALTSIIIGTGASTATTPELIVLHLHGPILFTFSRIAPIALSLILSWIVVERLGESVLQPFLLLTLVATSLSLRLIFEVNVWGYYFMAVSVVLCLVDVLRRRIRMMYILFLALVTLASIKGGIGDATAIFDLKPWMSQIVLAPFALILAISPIVGEIQQSRTPTPVDNENVPSRDD